MSTLIIGHRGAMGYAPENTAVSFQEAVKAGVDGVEFDLHLTKDRKLVVIHDEKLDRTTDGQGYIKDLTLQEIKNYDAGKHFHPKFAGEKILTLEETLAIVKDLKLINIELKNGPIIYPQLEEEVVTAIQNAGISQKVIISSFNHYSLHKIKELNSELKTGLLYMAGLYQPWQYAEMVGADAIHPYYAAVNEEIIAACHQAGIQVNVYGTNRETDIRKLIQAGVDMVITDYPDQALRIRREVEADARN